MSLTKYDPIKGCQVLNPEQFVVNAFHKDYVRTYMPEFLSDLRTKSAQQAQGVINGGKSKKIREAKNKSANTINLNPKPKFNIEKTEFYTYSRAGMPKGVKK